MSVSNELSSDLAGVLLEQEKRNDPVETRQLLAIVAQVHSSLKHLKSEERKKRHRLARPATTPITGSTAPRDI